METKMSMARKREAAAATWAARVMKRLSPKVLRKLAEKMAMTADVPVATGEEKVQLFLDVLTKELLS